MMIDAQNRWHHVVLTTTFEAEGCCFADMDGDGQEELVAGARWWKLDGSASAEFRDIPDAWLPPWGGGDRHDPHAHLREGGGPPQYKAATYDWGLTAPGALPRLLSVGMHLDPIHWYEPDGGRWRRHRVASGGIYESAVFTEVDCEGTRGLVTVPERPAIAWYEPSANPREPWREHRVGERGGNWHGLGVGALELGGAPRILTPTGSYASTDGIRKPWRWSDFRQICEDGHIEKGLGDVCLIHACAVGDDAPSLFAASPHGRGLWRWDLTDSNSRGRTYRRYDLGAQTSQLHALAVLPATPAEEVDAWIVTGKRWQAHGPFHDVDPASDPVLFRAGIFRDPRRPPQIELIDSASGVGLQIAVRRLDDDRMQIATANKMGVHVFTERKDET